MARWAKARAGRAIVEARPRVSYKFGLARPAQASVHRHVGEGMGDGEVSEGRGNLAALEECSDGWITAGNAFPGEDPSLALMPYWREGRRLMGRSTVTERDLLPMSKGALRGPLPIDAQGRCTSIAVGTYANRPWR